MTADDLSDADLKAAEPAAIVKLASVAQGVTGLLVALSGVQIVGLHYRSALLGAVPWIFLLGGVLQIVLAALVYRARPWAAFSAAALGGVVALTMTGWLFYTFPSMISCLQIIGTPLAVVSAIFAVIAIGGVRETAAARRRLSDQGMSLGL